MFALPLCTHLKNACVDVLHLGFVWWWDYMLWEKYLKNNTNIVNKEEKRAFKAQSILIHWWIKVVMNAYLCSLYGLLLIWSGFGWCLRSSSES